MGERCFPATCVERLRDLPDSHAAGEDAAKFAGLRPLHLAGHYRHVPHLIRKPGVLGGTSLAIFIALVHTVNDARVVYVRTS